VADDDVSLHVKEGNREDWLYKLDFSDQLLEAVPNLHQSVFVACDKEAQLWMSISTSNLVFMFILLVNSQLH